MNFLTLVWFQLDHYLFRRRWLLVMVVAVVVAVLFTNDLRVHRANSSGQPNIWDVLFRIWYNYHFHFLLLNILLVFLVVDIGAKNNWDDQLLLRIGSRRVWWLSKVVVLAICVIVYFLMLIIALLAGGGSDFPWEAGWSSDAQMYAKEWNFNPALFEYTPYASFGLAALLLVLGWFGLGLLTSTVCLVTDRFVWGFAAGMVANFTGFAALIRSVPASLEQISIQYHLLIHYHAFGDATSPYPSVQVSLLYWCMVISVLIFLGWHIAIRQDFLRYTP